MELNNQQKDALCELINIGFGRAASALSILVGQRVIIEAPFVNLYPTLELQSVLDTLSEGEITSVHQVFTGRIAGTAMLLMDKSSSRALADLLTGGASDEEVSEERDREVMQETGNILLNAFTGSFGNLLQVHVSFTVPSVHFNTLRNMLRSLVIEQNELEYALVVRVNFVVTSNNVNGYVLIVMGVKSMAVMMDAMRSAGYID